MADEEVDELMTEVARYGYIIHLLGRAEEEAGEVGNAELREEIDQLCRDARLERNLTLQRLGDADGC